MGTFPSVGDKNLARRFRCRHKPNLLTTKIYRRSASAAMLRLRNVWKAVENWGALSALRHLRGHRHEKMSQPFVTGVLFVREPDPSRLWV